MSRKENKERIKRLETRCQNLKMAFAEASQAMLAWEKDYRKLEGKLKTAEMISGDLLSLALDKERRLKSLLVKGDNPADHGPDNQERPGAHPTKLL